MNIEFSQPDILFYFSFQCPYSYMTWEMLKTMLKNKQITVCPIEVGLFPPGNTKFHFREIWGDPRWNRLIQDADKLGLRISKLDKYVSSLFVSRAIEAYGSASAEDYISSVFRGVFLTGINISLPNSVRMHLQSEGLDSSIFATAIENPATEKKPSIISISGAVKGYGKYPHWNMILKDIQASWTRLALNAIFGQL